MVILNLFSLFDPYTSLYFSLNWLGILFVFLIFPINYYYISSYLGSIHLLIIMKLFNEFKILIKSSYRNLMFISLMLIIFYLNFIGLFPYVFTLTRHIVLTFSFSLLI